MLESELGGLTKRFSILIVDDEPANLNLFTRTFRKDFDLHTARDGIDGLELLRSKQVDMIISDQRMPRMTGVEMLAASRNILPHAVRIILTAYSDVQDIIFAVNDGQIYRYNLKPWVPSELKSVVTQALDHYNLEKMNRDLVEKLKKSLKELNEAQAELVLSERMSGIGTMASTVIHDLKLPMTNIRTSAALLGGSNLDNIFDPFVTRGKHDGTGLGLAIVKRIIKNHGGSITVKNSEPAGAEFKIVLPIG